MIDILGVKAEKIDEENVRLSFADGSSLVMTIKEEKGNAIYFPTTAYLMCLALVAGLTEQGEGPGAAVIGDKPGIH